MELELVPFFVKSVDSSMAHVVLELGAAVLAFDRVEDEGRAVRCQLGGGGRGIIGDLAVSRRSGVSLAASLSRRTRFGHVGGGGLTLFCRCFVVWAILACAGVWSGTSPGRGGNGGLGGRGDAEGAGTGFGTGGVAFEPLLAWRRAMRRSAGGCSWDGDSRERQERGRVRLWVTLLSQLGKDQGKRLGCQPWGWPR